MKNRLTLVFSAAALFLSAGLLIWTLWGLAATPAPSPGLPVPTAVPAPPADPSAAYRLEKLNEVNDMVLRRAVVPEDYLRYLPEELREPVRRYSQDTAVLKNNYSVYAERVAKSLLYSFDPPPEDPGDYQRPERYYQLVGRISTLALYRNSGQLYRLDPVVSYPAAHEGGGSYGLWVDMIHEGWYVGEELAQQAEDYFTMLDGLFGQFAAARAALT